MSSDEHDDYHADIQFGDWLRLRRVHAKLSPEQVARLTGIAAERLKALEMGYSERGITAAEAAKLSTVYALSLPELLAKASNG